MALPSWQQFGVPSWHMNICLEGRAIDGMDALPSPTTLKPYNLITLDFLYTLFRMQLVKAIIQERARAEGRSLQVWELAEDDLLIILPCPRGHAREGNAVLAVNVTLMRNIPI